MGCQVHRESKWRVVDKNVAETIASGSQAGGGGREVKAKGTDTKSVSSDRLWVNPQGPQGNRAWGKPREGTSTQWRLIQLTLPCPVWLH